MRFRLIVAGVTATLVLVCTAFGAWFTFSYGDFFDLRRVNPPQMAWIEFSPSDGSESPIRLSGHSFRVLAEEMFAGCRAGPVSEQIEAKNATWVVTIGDTDGTKRQLAAYQREDGDCWRAGDTEHRVRGNVQLMLDARRGLEISNLIASDKVDWKSSEETVEVHGDAAIDNLLNMNRSPNAVQRATGLRALTAIISQRVRWEARLYHGIYRFCPLNSLASALDHPRAAEVRKVAMGMLRESFAGKLPPQDEYWLEIGAREAIAELADRPTTNALVELLRDRPAENRQAYRLMEAIERIYGLPPFVQPLGFCATGASTESRARAEAEELVRSRERRKLLLAWHNAHRDESRIEQLGLAVAAWKPDIERRDAYREVCFPALAYNSFKPLLRQGADVVPMLREAQRQAPQVSQKATYELLLVLLTSRHDAELVEELDRGDHVQKDMALRFRQISAAN